MCIKSCPVYICFYAKLLNGYFGDVFCSINSISASLNTILRASIIFFYPANGIQHCNGHHKEHAENADSHTAPRENKIDIVRPAADHPFVNQPGRDCCYGKPEEQRPQAIKGTLEIHHLLEIPFSHAHGAEHGKLPQVRVHVEIIKSGIIFIANSNNEMEN